MQCMWYEQWKGLNFSAQLLCSMLENQSQQNVYLSEFSRLFLSLSRTWPSRTLCQETWKGQSIQSKILFKKSISYGKFTSWLRTYDCSVSNWPCAPLDLLRLAGGPADLFGCAAERHSRPGRTHRLWNPWGLRYRILASALTAFVTFCVITSVPEPRLSLRLCDWDISFGKNGLNT